ncbi:protein DETOXIFICATION 16 isoform X2 [Physcomitrium patens]|nr:protein DETOXIFICATION 16-like isoform X2 [Physcomitrium patens]XP_024395362.1 protein DETOXIFICATION 16-like isoform X2 [Physcomitrium patens]|eukprot:XP_024395361.1 protein DETOXIFICATION 16-like isoform X2 [Physcomitrella patens]
MSADSGGRDGESIRGLFTTELSKQLWLAGPMIAVNFLEYSLLVVSVMFVGHLGELSLAGAALASSFAAVSGLSLLVGMGCALETLCGQSFGAKNYQMVGIYLQRGIIVLFLTAIPVAAIWWNMTNILIALGQDPEIAEKSGEYARFLIPSLFAYAAIQPLVKFLQAQSLVFVMSFSSLTTLCFFHIPLCYLMIFKLGVGFRGAAIATSVSNWVNVTILATYVRFSPHCKQTWTGLSREAFEDLAGLFTLAVPSAIMVCFEYWSFELLVIFSGLLPNPKLETSALSVCLTTSSLMYMIPYGLGAATSTRVSNELGASNPNAARRAVAVSLCLAALEGSAVATFLFSARMWWGWLFTSDAEVANYVSQVMPILACLSCVDSIQGVLSGVVRGGGWQTFGAVTNLSSYYVVGLPVGILLAFKYHYNDFGFWIGMLGGILTQVLILSMATARTNWEQQARDAVNRVGGPTKLSAETNQPKNSDSNSLLAREEDSYVLIE